KPAAERRGHAGSILGLAFSPDGRYLASCGEAQDQTIRIWDLADTDLPTVAILQGHQAGIKSVAFVTGERLVSAGGRDANGRDDGTIRLWDWRAPQPLVSWLPSTRQKGTRITALAVSPDGGYVVVGRENGSLERYDAADLRNGAILIRED